MTQAERKTYVNQRLSDGSEITALKHREVEIMLLDVIADLELSVKNLGDEIKKTAPLAKGTYVMGDVTGWDRVFTVSFPDVETNSYVVALYPVSNSSDFNIDNDVFFMTREHSRTSFKICAREVNGGVQNLSIDWEIKKK